MADMDFWDSVAGGEGAEDVPPAAPVAARPVTQPTGYTSNQLDSKAERNQINEAMRNSPQWRDAIKAFGLNPDGPLKLNKKQQQGLAQQLGLPVKDFHIDPAGNINDYHGWKGLPVAAKVAIIAGGAVATGGLGGMFSGGAGAFGVGGGAAGGAAGAGATTLASTSLPTAALMGGAPAIASGAVSAVPLASTLGAGGGGALFGGASVLNGASPTLASTVAPNIATTVAPKAATGLRGFLTQPGMRSQLLSGAFNLGQGAIAANSARRAAEIQAQYGNRALDFEQQRYDRSVANTQPYVDAGRGAFTSLGSVLQPRPMHNEELQRLARGGQ